MSPAYDGPLIEGCRLYLMRLWLIPLDHALPALQAHLSQRNDEPLDPAESETVAELLERCVRTGEALVEFAQLVGGRPSPQ